MLVLVSHPWIWESVLWIYNQNHRKDKTCFLCPSSYKDNDSFTEQNHTQYYAFVSRILPLNQHDSITCSSRFTASMQSKIDKEKVERHDNGKGWCQQEKLMVGR